jgi:replicative DNA helicase
MTNITEIEQNIIGAFIENEDLFSKCPHLESVHLFSSQVNKISYKLIKAIRSKGIKPDTSLLNRELLKVKGMSASMIPLYATTHKYLFQPEEYIVMLVEENMIKKSLMPVLHNAYSSFNENSESPLDIMRNLSSKINDVELFLNNVSGETNILDVFDAALEDLKATKSGKKKSGSPTGIESLDNITGGLRPGIIVVGARPGMGKTTFLVNTIVENAIYRNKPIIFFSLEMKAIQIIKNIWANMHEFNTMNVRDGNLDDDDVLKIEQCRSRFKDNLEIDDTPGITWQYIDAKIAKKRKTIPMSEELIVMIDYIQLMCNTQEETQNKTDEAQMSLRCRGLMNLSKKYNCCTLELSQLSREVEKRQVKRPMISDLKESGAIEANADQIWLLYRPDYYDKNATDENGNSLAGKIEFGVQKNRGGRTGFAYADFEMRYAKFKKIEKLNEGNGII